MRLAILSFLTIGALAAAIQPPEQYFGFRIGADKKLVRYDKIVEYFQKVAAESDRVRFRNLGPTTMGNPFVMLEISSADNLQEPRPLQGPGAQALLPGRRAHRCRARRDFPFGQVGRLHHQQHSLHRNRLVADGRWSWSTGWPPKTRPRSARSSTTSFFCWCPRSIPTDRSWSPTGTTRCSGTPNEASPLPWLYHEYTGHDNNRDMYLFSQKESRMAAQVLWHEWFPSIWLDEHQQGMSGPRIFTMPATDPINPNVDPLIYRLNGVYRPIAGRRAGGRRQDRHHL